MLHQISTPLIKTLVANLRDQRSDALRFRHTVKEITKHLLNSALKSSQMKIDSIRTWRGRESFEMIDLDAYMVVSVLRAAMPMQESVMETLPLIQAGFLAIQRDEKTHKSHLYYDRLPDCQEKIVILVDVMLATGGSLCDAVEIITSRGAQKIISLNVIASPEGVEQVEQSYPEVDIYVAQLDEKLNEDKFIIPGLGDAGDREYNTL